MRRRNLFPKEGHKSCHERKPQPNLNNGTGHHLSWLIGQSYKTIEVIPGNTESRERLGLERALQSSSSNPLPCVDDSSSEYSVWTSWVHPTSLCYTASSFSMFNGDYLLHASNRSFYCKTPLKWGWVFPNSDVSHRDYWKLLIMCQFKVIIKRKWLDSPLAATSLIPKHFKKTFKASCSLAWFLQIECLLVTVQL